MKNNGETEDMIEINREVSEVKTMLGMLIKAVDELKVTLSSSYVPRMELDERLRSQGERIGKLENAITWISRTVIGAIVVGVISFIYMSK